MTGKYIICNDCENVNIFESEEMEKAWAILFADKNKTFSVVQISPSVRVSIGEKFGMHSGEDCMGKIATALCAMGADAVVDSAIGADIVALEDAKKLVSRKGKGVKAPLFSSKCAYVADYLRAKYPDIEVSKMANENSINAALLKDCYKAQTGKTVRVISVEPCKEKKFLLNVDAVITADELEVMLAEVEDVGVSLRTLKKRVMDMPLGVPTGGAYITEFSGGMAEAVARNLCKENNTAFVDKLSYSGFYGRKKRREASVTVDGKTYTFAIVCGMDGAESLIKDVREGKACYDYVEITACEGGCVRGGELPETKDNNLRLRRKGLQDIDKKRSARVAVASSSALEMQKNYKGWLRKKKAGLLEEETDVEPVVIDEEFTVTSSEDASIAEKTEEVLELVPATEENVEKTVEPVPATEEKAEETVEPVPAIEEKMEENEKILAIDEIAATEVDAIMKGVIKETVEEIIEENGEVYEIVELTKESGEVVQVKRKADPYRVRLSGRDRRKKKRMNKANKKNR